MDKTMLGVIDATTYKESLEDLTVNRSLAAIPYAGRYRLIDFILSNMVNSGINSVAIFPKYQYRSLMDHLGSGKQWDLNRKRDGLFFFPTPGLDALFDYFGSFRQFENNLDFFLRSRQRYTLITNSHTICNIDFKMVLSRHIQGKCDITEVRHKGKSLEMYVLETKLLIDLVKNQQKTGYNSIVEVVRDHKHQLTVCDYEFEGYVAVIDSISKYYSHSLELLKPEIWNQVFIKANPIYTKVKDQPPTQYMKDAVVKNSMIANGCIIEGHVENSIIFRGVKVGKNAIIKNSIVMQKNYIGNNCEIEYCIFDKDVKIKDSVSLRGDKLSPLVIRKGTVQGALMNS